MTKNQPIKHLHGQGNVQQLIAPEMRQQIVGVKRQLDENAGHPRSKSLKSRPYALVDWGRVLHIMSDKLKFCTNELNKQRQGILKIERKYFPPEATGKKPTFESLEILEYAFADLTGFNDVVKCLERLEEFRHRAAIEVMNILCPEEEDDREEDDFWFDPF